MKHVFFLVLLFCSVLLHAENKEVLIIGTMHTVPNIVKNSYKPLLKYAIKYEPDAIYAENVRPEDTVSLINDAPKFISLSDSIKKQFVTNPLRFDSLHNANLYSFNESDFGFMKNSYLVKRDYANYYYYKYLEKYGLNGSDKPLRHESADLTNKLAIAMNLKYIFSMDDQTYRKEYHLAWENCGNEGVDNGDNEINNKMSKKAFRKSILPALTGRLGKHTNKSKSLELYHTLNSFRYVKNKTAACQEGRKYWDDRNKRMATNIGEQITTNSHQKNIVIVGAGHVVGLKAELEKLYPEIIVKVMFE